MLTGTKTQSWLRTNELFQWRCKLRYWRHLPVSTSTSVTILVSFNELISEVMQRNLKGTFTRLNLLFCPAYLWTYAQT